MSVTPFSTYRPGVSMLSASHASNSPAVYPAPTVYFDGALYWHPIRSSLCSHRRVVLAPDPVQLVLAQRGCVRPVLAADLDAELVPSHEAKERSDGSGKEDEKGALGPLNNLLDVLVEPSRVHQTANWIATLRVLVSSSPNFKRRITHQILTVRIVLSTPITLGNIDVSLLDEARDHDVVRSSQELSPSERASGHESCTMATLRAPRNRLAF